MKEEIYFINQLPENKKLIRLGICGITFPDKNYEITRSKSLTACIEYIDKGCGTVNLDDTVFCPTEGDTYFLFEGQSQHYYSNPRTPWKKYWINLSGNFVTKMCEMYDIKTNYFKGLDTKKELKEIIHTVKNADSDCTLKIIEILNRIFYKMRAHTRNEKALSSVPYKMREYLDTHLTEAFKIAELCNLISKSESQTIKIFKAEFGTTPYKYFCIKKTELAKNMIINTNLSIKQIAYALNYADEYYFSNSFKQHTGKSPSEYRKRLN